MRWYRNLYTGRYASIHRASIIRGLRHGKDMPSVYVIARAMDSDGILEIYRSQEFRKEYYQKKDPLVVGLAMSRTEAEEVVRQIVDDLYRWKGDFDIDAFCDTDHT